MTDLAQTILSDLTINNNAVRTAEAMATKYRVSLVRTIHAMDELEDINRGFITYRGMSLGRECFSVTPQGIAADAAHTAAAE